MDGGGFEARTPKSKLGAGGILRDPETPGTGSSVRFGMRVYENGEESILTSSLNSTRGADDEEDADEAAVLGQVGAGASPERDDTSLRLHLGDGSTTQDGFNIANASLPMHGDVEQSFPPGGEGSSLEMSFTESFLKREVGDALAGLGAAPSRGEQPAPKTPAKAGPASPPEAPATVRPALRTSQESPGSPLGEETQKLSASASAEQGHNGHEQEHGEHSEGEEGGAETSLPGEELELGRQGQEDLAQEGHEPSLEQDQPAPQEAQPEHPKYPEQEQDQEPKQEQETEERVQRSLDGSGRAERAERAEQVEQAVLAEQSVHPDQPERPAPSEQQAPSEQLAIGPALPALGTPAHPPKTPLASSAPSGTPSRTPGRTDSSFASSFASYTTPLGDASSSRGQATPSERSTPGRWPGMYEHSFWSEKEELDDEEAGALVPYDVEELSSKLVSIESLGNVDTHELLGMVAALDRTHSERTIFLQHRLARSHRLCQVLRANLEQAHARVHLFETHVHEFLQRKAELDQGMSESLAETHQAELLTLTEQLESRLAALPEGRAPALPAPGDTSVGRARRELHEEQEHLAMQRRDLEIRLAQARQGAADDLPADGVSASEVQRRIDEAVSLVRGTCERDAEVRVHMARSERDAEVAALRSELAQRREAPSNEALYEAQRRHEEAQEHWSLLEMELVEERARLQERCAQLETDAAAREAALAEQRRQAQHADAEHAVALRRLQDRVAVLEHESAHRGLELVRLDKSRERLARENMHYSLALAAKQQELELIKRGTRAARHPERRPLQARSANVPAAPRVASAQKPGRQAAERRPPVSPASLLDSLPRAPQSPPETSGSSLRSSDMKGASFDTSGGSVLAEML